MSVLDLGDPWVYDFKVYDVNGALAAAGAFAITVSVAPTGSVATPSFAIISTGVYRVTFVPDVAGRYSLYGQATGANACAQSEQIDVRATASYALLSLNDAKGILGKSLTVTTDDEKIRDKIDAVTAWLEKRIGRVIPRTVTEDLEFWRDSFMVRQTPVISLTSLTPVMTGGTALAAADYQVLSTGRIVRKDGAWLSAAPWNLYTVVYQAGRVNIDPDILEAARVLLQHFWDTQRSDFTGPGLGDDGVNQYNDLPIPPRIYTLIAPHTRFGLA